MIALSAVTAIAMTAGAAAPARAAYNEGDPCKPGERVMLIGGGTGDLTRTVVMDCSPENTWSTTATYISDRAVIIEKRGIDISFSTYSPLNPFLKDLDITRAPERFPDPKGAVWSALRAYVLDVLSPKAQAVASRRSVSAADACTKYPVQSTDEQIRANPMRFRLPPMPTPDGKTGTLTYSLAASLTGDERSAVLDALSQYDSAQAGTKLPRLVVIPAGSTEKPTITFRDATSSLSATGRAASTLAEVVDVGRAGLRRWKSGSISLNDDDELSEAVVLHEILHVLGFQHVPGLLDSSNRADTTMSPAVGANGVQRAGPFEWPAGDEAPVDHAVDPCTQKGMNLADPRY